MLQTLRKVGRLLDDYAEINGAITMPIRLLGKGGLCHVIQQRQGIGVDISILDWQAERLQGCVLRYGEPKKLERAEILISATLPGDWARFIVARELSHLILDGPESFLGDPVNHAIQVMDSPLFAKGAGGQPEYLYDLAALELLVPWRRRHKLPAYRWGFLFANARRAKHFGVPQRLMALRVSRGYNRMLGRHYEDLAALPRG